MRVTEEDEEIVVVTIAVAEAEATVATEVIEDEGTADSFQIFIQKKYIIKTSHLNIFLNLKVDFHSIRKGIEYIIKNRLVNMQKIIIVDFHMTQILKNRRIILNII